MRKLLTLLCVMSLCSAAFALDGDAIVLCDSTVVEVTGQERYACTQYRRVLILDSRGVAECRYTFFSTADIGLDRFRARLYDVGNTLLRTVTRKELESFPVPGELAASTQCLSVEIAPPSFPCIVEYEASFTCSGNCLSYPRFMPQDASRLGVQSAVYSITFPDGLEPLWHASHCNLEPVRTSAGRRTTLTFRLDNLAPLPDGDFDRPLRDRLPSVCLAPATFRFYRHEGSLQSWQTLGAWNWELMEDRHLLPEAAKAFVHQLTDTCRSDSAKLALLHRHLADHTRYVSLQLGIGGYQPMSAADVWRLGFGDCKALSNYLRALLREAGITSHCAAISTLDARLLPGFPNFQQMDHMVLEVILDGKPMWVECTNPQLPLGCMPLVLQGHEALEISATGGRVVTLPEVEDSLNVISSSAEVWLKPDGSAEVQIDDRYMGNCYFGASRLASLPQRDLHKKLLSGYRIPQGEIVSVSLDDPRTPYAPPQFATRLKARSARYAARTGTRLFVPLSPVLPAVKTVDEGAEFCVRRSLAERHRILYHLPDGYVVESMPKAVDITADFGRLGISCSRSEGQLLVSMDFTLSRGDYPAGQLAQFNAMARAAAKAYGQQIVLKAQ